MDSTTEKNPLNIFYPIKESFFYIHPTLLSSPYPQMISLESTNYCNLSCSHCGHTQFSKFQKGHLDIKFFDIISPLVGTKIKHLSLSNFGEPFIAKSWHTLFKKALSVEELRVSFITNGITMDKHLDALMNPKISFAISIDGISEKTYEYFRGKGNFAILIRNLNLLKTFKKDLGVDYPEVTFLFTVSKINCHELTGIVELAHFYGVRVVIIQMQVFFKKETFEKESLYLSKDTYNSNISEASKRASELGVLLIHPDSFDGNTLVNRDNFDNQWLSKESDGTIKCHSQLKTCYIKYNGDVEACCVPTHNIMGNISLNSFNDIWHGPKYRNLRLSLDRGQIPQQCSFCNLFQTVDINSIRAHLIELPDKEISLPNGTPKYSITEIERKYQEALNHIKDDNPHKALKVIRPIADIDKNLFEINNLMTYLYALQKNYKKMSLMFQYCIDIAPKDPVVIANKKTISSLLKLKSPWVNRLINKIKSLL